MTKHLKIGIDYHGVINKEPLFFKELIALALKSGHQITVLSGGSEKDVKKYLDEHNITYSQIFSLLDYFTKRNLVTFYEDGSFYVENEIWNKAKANYCSQNGVDLHIDDSMLYGSYFQTPFCLYSPTNDCCTFIKKNVTLNFKKEPSEVLSDIVAYFEDSV